jgi:uncharacterized DUF497 family protein
MPGIGPFEWDEAKWAANLHVHGIDFRDVLRFDWDSAQLTHDIRRDYGETRIIAVGRIGPRVHVLVLTLRAERIRIISLRKANNREIRQYEKNKNQA